jgi:hypothetical protein
MSELLTVIKKNGSILALFVSLIGGMITVTSFVVVDHSETKQNSRRLDRNDQYIKESEAARRQAIRLLQINSSNDEIIIKQLDEVIERLERIENEQVDFYILNPQLRNPRTEQ